MEKIDYSKGPFGAYERETSGHVLNALCHYGIPVNTVDSLYFANKEVKNNRGQTFARYKYFDDLEQPLFYFTDHSLNKQKGFSVDQVDGKNVYVPNFRLNLSSHETPGLTIEDELATPELHQMLCRTLTNWMNDPWYNVHKDAGAFFQGGYADENGKWFYIEFWRPGGAQAYVDKLNAEYRPTNVEV